MKRHTLGTFSDLITFLALCVRVQYCIYVIYPVKNVTRIFPRPFDGSLVENETKSDGNPIIFVANAMEIP